VTAETSRTRIVAAVAVMVPEMNSIQNQTFGRMFEEVVVSEAVVAHAMFVKRCSRSTCSILHPVLAQVPLLHEPIDGSKMTAVNVAQQPVLDRNSLHMLVSSAAVVAHGTSAPVAAESIDSVVFAEREMPNRQASCSCSAS
jgi:hypothetical protein